MADIHDVADYLIVQLSEAGEMPSVHRLHKLLYYVQGWHLAVHDRPLFPERFQAWVHGPICRVLFDRFASSRSLYAGVGMEDVRECFAASSLTPAERNHVDKVLDGYGIYPTFQLMRMSREDSPWLKARGRLPIEARCDAELDDDEMRKCFRAQMEETDEVQARLSVA
ncbi:Panacea domain-containing protein [Roseateles noduli]|jgi:uncharacterized phage-associated protein|uniref:Panacea domain-containing protein n=1 Tax=Roseateles noduli TaxID=2052484 RepID=UPI003D64A0C7